MKKQNKSFIKNPFFVFIFFIVLFFAPFIVQKVIALDQLNNKLQVFMQVLQFVKNDYVEQNIDDKKVVYGAIKGMLEALDDPYTRFMEPTSFKEMKMRMKGSYFGIGIYIGIRHKALTVISPISDTPASKAGLKAGDIIATINGKDTKNMALEEAVSHIRGPRGTPVKIGIRRKGVKKIKVYTLLRDKIVVKNIEKKIFDGSIGYIKLNSFENINASEKMETAVNDLKKADIKGLILDLRNNGGGLLSNAVGISSMFLKNDSVVVLTIDRDGNKEEIRSSGDPIWQGPLVVLINEGSASASEILAGAIRDNGKGTLVGYHTFGKASVQSVKQLLDGSAVLLTIAKYLTPSGRDITKKGINPDIEVRTGKENISEDEMASEEAEPLPEEEPDSTKDIQLKKAIGVIKLKIGEIK